MLRKQRETTTVVSVLLVTITITLTLTLTLTVSATAAATTEITSTIPTTTTTTTTENISYTETTAAISKKEEGNETASASAAAATTTTAAETTTTTVLTLQPPPLNVTSPTTSSYEPETEAEPKPKVKTGSESESAESNFDSDSDSVSEIASKSKDATAAAATAVETTTTKNSINHVIDKTDNIADVKHDNKKTTKKEEGGSASAITADMSMVMEEMKTKNQEEIALSTETPKAEELVSLSSSQSAAKKHFPLFSTPHGFQLSSDINDTRHQKISTPTGYLSFAPKDPIEYTAHEKQKKSESVTKVLSNLFPNGFSDIFRLSYGSESTTTKSSNLNLTSESVPEPRQTISYTKSITKEYRRLLSPGHTEVVVESLGTPNTSEEFKDGTNSISKDELLRINRAAADSPVLPSLLVKPTQGNDTVESAAAPIVILKETLEQDDFSDEVNDDNLIAESQDIAQHVFQSLPVPIIPKIDKLKSQHEPQINVEIIHDETLKQQQKRVFGQRLFTPAAEIQRTTEPTPESNKYEQNAAEYVQQPNQTPEAPSRKFLKHFNPQLSAENSESGLVKKGQFHYESIGRQQRLKTTTVPPGDYGENYVKPAAQLQYQRQHQHHQQISGSQPVKTSPDYKGYESTPRYEHSNPEPENAPESVVFVTINTPTPPRVVATPKPITLISSPRPEQTPHEYVAEAIGAASSKIQTTANKVDPNHGYTYVEVQKSVNIHNKLITEQDGKLLEQHETIFHQPEYGKNVAINTSPQKNYVSLSENPINVQHIDDNSETPEIAASQTAVQQLSPPAAPVQVNYVEKIIPQPYPVPVEKVVERPYPVTQVVEKPVPAPYPVNQIVEKIVDRPVAVEKIVERPVNVPYPVHHYIDRPYPVREIVEQTVAVPYAVPEPVAVPVPVETYIDRPYPVETIIEKHVPYPVETIVEKVVETHVPVEVERIVETPKIVEKVVEKLVDRPIAIPIHVPVAVPVPPYPSSHPNALQWAQGPPNLYRSKKIPPKVLQNYYMRMLKKFLGPQNPNNALGGHSSPVPQFSTTKVTQPTQPKTPIQFTKPPFKISDIRFDLKPPPPPLGPSWQKGARYIYNTLPTHLTAELIPDQDFGPQQEILFIGTAPHSDIGYDEFQRWRNGQLLKRSPDFGRNLHIEYGFKPPLVPSLEIDENGMPLKSALPQKEE